MPTNVGILTFMIKENSFIRFVVVQAYRGLTSEFLLLRIFSVAISVSPHVCCMFDLINFVFYVSKIMHL